MKNLIRTLGSGDTTEIHRMGRKYLEKYREDTLLSEILEDLIARIEKGETDTGSFEMRLAGLATSRGG